MGDLGTQALEDTQRIDFGRLRAQRRSRCLEAMERHDLDALLLGREANARYASGARRLRTALAAAESGLSWALDHLRPGVREGELRGAFAERMTAFGVTVPGAEAEFRTTDGGRPRSADTAIDQGRLVACSVSALYAGYEGSLARTWPCSPAATSTSVAGPSDDQRHLHRRWEEMRRRLL